jgi:hypothetical protein
MGITELSELVISYQGADKLLKKIGFKGLPELHLIDTSGKNILIVDPEQTLRNA